MEILSYGSSGPYVEMLQLALIRAGYSLKIDGIFGTSTQRAVISFQNQSGLAADGIVGAKTWQALHPYLSGYVEHVIRTGDTFYRLAQSFGSTIRMIEIANPNLNPLFLPVGSRIIIPLSFPVVPTNIRFTYRLLMYCIEGLLKRYPFLRSGNIGNSIINHTIPYITIGSGEKQAFFNASHHANEWITTPILMKFIEDYSRAYAFDSEIYNIPARNLYTSSALYIVPMVNPDGVDLVTGAFSDKSAIYRQAAEISADYPAISFPDGWKANIIGTDLNLNYPAGWEYAKEIKYANGFISPAPRDFVGTSPLSAPESRAVYNFTLTHDFTITLSYHSQGQVIYWKYLDYEPENAEELALRFAEASGYEVADTPYSSGFAGYKDWFIQTYNRPGYTIEVGLGENPLPISSFPDIYNNNLGILALALAL